MDYYEAMIVNISNMYGDKFYEYHKMFSLKSASELALYNIKIDWWIRDRDLLQLITANARVRSCNICNEVSHDTKFCPLSAVTQPPQYQGISNQRTASKNKPNYEKM